MKIKIKDLKIQGIIGIYQKEKLEKQTILVNLEIDYDEGDSKNSDNIDEGLNYHPICEYIRNLIENNQYGLIEKLVNDIGNYVISLDKVKTAYVEVDKPEAPIEGLRSVSVSEIFSKNK